MKVKSGYNPPRFAGELDVRPMSAQEAMRLKYGDQLMFLDQHNHIRECRISGNPKTWKTRPGHVRIPIKYGMYENSYAESYGELSDTVTVGTGKPIVVLI